MASPSLPFVIIGSGGLLAAALSLNLPETADAALSNTLEEAEAFGQGEAARGFFYMPLVEQYGLRKRRKGRREESRGADNVAMET